METTQTNLNIITDTLAGEKRFPPIIRSIWFSLNQSFRQRLINAGTGITPNQFTVLRWLTEFPHNELSQKDITLLMSSDANTIASLMRRMEEDGLISRITSPEDRRCNIPQITEKGRQVLSQAQPIAMELQAEIFSTLTEEERELFINMLIRVADSCRSSLRTNTINTIS
ncbi:MAG: MarR family transcriptional regulator [Verrucomicrobiota bacterium]